MFQKKGFLRAAALAWAVILSIGSLTACGAGEPEDSGGVSATHRREPSVSTTEVSTISTSASGSGESGTTSAAVTSSPAAAKTSVSRAAERTTNRSTKPAVSTATKKTNAPVKTTRKTPAATTTRKPSPAATTTRKPSPPAATTQAVDPASYPQEVLRLVNAERQKAGKSPLSADEKLNKAAQIRAKEIAVAFSHTRPDGQSCFTVLKEQGVSYLTAGENIAMGQRTPAEVIESWMHSEGHRKNILSDNFGRLGVGYYVEGGAAHWVQLFTN